jgi:hypothetical protein
MERKQAKTQFDFWKLDMRVHVLIQTQFEQNEL